MTFTFKADDYMLIATRDSRYAHSLSEHGPGSWTSGTACGRELTAHDPNGQDHLTQRFVKGKPPCPKCIRALQFKAHWMMYYAQAYAMLGD